MVSKQQLSLARSLHQKKFRQMYGKFLVEGDKLVRELLNSSFKIDTIFCLKTWQLPSQRINAHVIEVSEAELRKIATHENPDEVVAIACIPVQANENEIPHLNNGLYLLCDNLNDPGNAGTIIRTAEWFGVAAVFFSENSVDIYNPKVVSAAKGSLFRVACSVAPATELLKANKHLKVYGTFMEGDNIYSANIQSHAFIVIGNEANGISEEVRPWVNQKITIPSFGKAESLNAAIATAVVLSEFRRRG
jgi:TrmH family RNA methyltransferase